MKLTGAEIVAEMLVREGVPYAIGIPGHGILSLVDALRRRRDKIAVIMPRHEQAAMHMADGYYRVRGEPLAVYTSIGAGAANTAIGLANAYVDSVPVLLFIGETHTYMRGVGVLQEIERQRWSDLPNMLAPATKRSWHIDRAGQLARAMGQAFNVMCTGRPGPALIDLPMDVQAETVEMPEAPDAWPRRPHDRPAGDPEAIRQAAQMLVNARRPVIHAGGGVLLAGGDGELRLLAEHLGAAVVTTMMGKSAFPEDHPLAALSVGANATTSGRHMVLNADVMLSLGVRFADKAASSYRPGGSFNIPPTKLIHVDIDPFEIGKNFPVELGIVGDARAVLAALLEEVRALTPPRRWQDAAYTREIAEQVARWNDTFRALAEAGSAPVTMARMLAEIRKALPAEGIVVSSSGNTQIEIYQQMTFTQPRTYLSAGGFSTMGWAFPAAMGAKLAAPERPVVAIAGDGDFLMTFQELATAVQYNIPVVAVVANNIGWQCIRDLQTSAYGPDADYGTMFACGAQPVTPHIADAARAFGAHAVRISRPDEVGPALTAALAARRPAVIEVMVDSAPGKSGGQLTGWWDVPIPGYYPDKRSEYVKGRDEERV